MSGLVLKLGPRERVLVNGVVVENGDRRTKLHILTFLVRELCAANLVLSVVDNDGLPYNSDQCQV